MKNFIVVMCRLYRMVSILIPSLKMDIMIYIFCTTPWTCSQVRINFFFQALFFLSQGGVQIHMIDFAVSLLILLLFTIGLN